MTEIADRTRRAPAQGREIGGLISGVFGVVFVAVNSGALESAVRLSLVAVAAIALLAILILIVRNLRLSGRPHRGGKNAFGRGYWTVVAVEAVALFGGTRLLTGLGHPELGVAWVSFVVGTPFFALGQIFRLRRFHVLAVLVTVCGLTGFALAGFGSAGLIAVVAGVIPGFILLGSGLWAVTPRP